MGHLTLIWNPPWIKQLRLNLGHRFYQEINILSAYYNLGMIIGYLQHYIYIIYIYIYIYHPYWKRNLILFRDLILFFFEVSNRNLTLPPQAQQHKNCPLDAVVKLLQEETTSPMGSSGSLGWTTYHGVTFVGTAHGVPILSEADHPKFHQGMMGWSWTFTLW